MRANTNQLDRFSDGARRVLAVAADEANRLNHSTINTEHLLLALVLTGEGSAVIEGLGLGVELRDLGLILDLIIRQVNPPGGIQYALPPGVEVTKMDDIVRQMLQMRTMLSQRVLERISEQAKIPVGNQDRLVTGVKKAIEMALVEAVELHQTCIGPEHLLLGLAGEGQGIAAGVFRILDIGVDELRQVVKAQMGKSSTGGGKRE